MLIIENKMLNMKLYDVEYLDVFSIILLYNLYISIVVKSKLQTDHFVKIREKKKHYLQ